MQATVQFAASFVPTVIADDRFSTWLDDTQIQNRLSMDAYSPTFPGLLFWFWLRDSDTFFSQTWLSNFSQRFFFYGVSCIICILLCYSRKTEYYLQMKRIVWFPPEQESQLSGLFAINHVFIFCGFVDLWFFWPKTQQFQYFLVCSQKNIQFSLFFVYPFIGLFGLLCAKWLSSKLRWGLSFPLSSESRGGQNSEITAAVFPPDSHTGLIFTIRALLALCEHDPRR